MKVLVATTETQGQHPGDFTWCITGELVIPPLIMCTEDIYADDPETTQCGCGRSFIGLSSGKYTTTAENTDLDTNLAGYITAIADGLAAQGWRVGYAPSIAHQLAEHAARYPLGTIYGYRPFELHIRRRATP